MEKYHGNTVEYWKQNAEENYLTTPISVLKYITVLEEQAEQLRQPPVVGRSEELPCPHCGQLELCAGNSPETCYHPKVC
jgi:hypothetical protein